MQADRLDLTIANASDGPLLVAAHSAQDTPRLTPPHRHARGQAFGASRGLLVVTTDHGRWVVPATHAVWVPPQRWHGVQVHGPYDGWSCYVAEAACGDLPHEPFTLRMSGLLREAVLRATQWDGGPLDAAQTHVAQVVLDEIRSAVAEPLGLPMPQDARLLRLAQGLLQRLDDARTLQDWADEVGMATRTAARRFVAETGFSFSEWRQRARLLQAIEWLAAGRTVTAVALDLGYDNVSAFIAMFRRVLGTTPGRYVDGADG